MLSEEMVRLQLWDQLSGGLDARDLLRDDAPPAAAPAGLASRLLHSLRGRRSGSGDPDGTIRH